MWRLSATGSTGGNYAWCGLREIRLFSSGICAERAADANYDRWRLDLDRSLLEQQEKRLLRAYDDLRQRDAELDRTINVLIKQQYDVSGALRRVRQELNCVQTQLL
jgi:hypothetical protein